MQGITHVVLISPNRLVEQGNMEILKVRPYRVLRMEPRMRSLGISSGLFQGKKTM